MSLETLEEVVEQCRPSAGHRRGAGKCWSISPSLERAARHVARSTESQKIETTVEPTPVDDQEAAGDPFAVVVTDYDSLITACRARCDQLSISRQTIDAICGWAPGWAHKVLSATPYTHTRTDGMRASARRLGMQSLGPLLSALGIRLVDRGP
jgi:hypothetical protein